MGARNLMWGPCLWCFGERLSPQLREVRLESCVSGTGQGTWTGTLRKILLAADTGGRCLPFCSVQKLRNSLSCKHVSCRVICNRETPAKSSKSTCGESYVNGQVNKPYHGSLCQLPCKFTVVFVLKFLNNMFAVSWSELRRTFLEKSFKL